jgi:hypothetical protein
VKLVVAVTYNTGVLLHIVTEMCEDILSSSDSFILHYQQLLQYTNIGETSVLLYNILLLR